MNDDQLRALTLLLIFSTGIPVYFAYLLGMTAFASYRLAPPPLAPGKYVLARHLFYVLFFLMSLAALSWCIASSSLVSKSDVASLGPTDNDTGLLLLMMWMPWLPWSLGIASVRSNPLWLRRFFQRPKILLFRPFGDRSASAAIFYQFANVLSEMGRAYALVPSGKISRRRELRNQMLRLALPRLNPIRLLTVPDECWQDRVRELLSDADAVIIDVTSPTESVEWELELALRIAGERRVILVAQEGHKTDCKFSRIIRYRRPSRLLLPQRESTAIGSLQDALSTIIATHGKQPGRDRPW